MNISVNHRFKWPSSIAILLYAKGQAVYLELKHWDSNRSSHQQEYLLVLKHRLLEHSPCTVDCPIKIMHLDAMFDSQTGISNASHDDFKWMPRRNASYIYWNIHLYPNATSACWLTYFSWSNSSTTRGFWTFCWRRNQMEKFSTLDGDKVSIQWISTWWMNSLKHGPSSLDVKHLTWDTFFITWLIGNIAPQKITL